MTKFNPYNFVPLESRNPSRTQWEDLGKHHRLAPEAFSGRFVLQLRTLAPVFIPSRRPEDIQLEKFLWNTRNGREIRTRRTFKRFHHNNDDPPRPTIPAASIKGMVRSVFEAITNSCMALFAETFRGQTQVQTYPASNHLHTSCNKRDGLCPACAVFGTIQDDTIFQGKVRFSEAVGINADLEPGEWILKELSSPKPGSHVPFYAQDGSSPGSGPRGRKFFFHHDPQIVAQPTYIVKTTADRRNPGVFHDHRNVKILERLQAKAGLMATLDIQGLTEPELAFLLYAITLGNQIEEKEGKKVIRYSLAHKIGMGKPLGLGSVIIIVPQGVLHQGPSRYRSYGAGARCDFTGLVKALLQKYDSHLSLPQEFQDLLSISKCGPGNTIEYPSYGWFHDPATRSMPLGRFGEFD